MRSKPISDARDAAAKKGLVFINARALTLEDSASGRFASGEPEAVVTDGAKLLYVGKQNEIDQGLFNDREVIDLKGLTLVPGFIDSHIHLLELARSHLGKDLWECKSIKELLDLLKEESVKLAKGQWLIGYNWDESRWQEGRYVTIEELDGACPDNAVFLKRICLHQALVNSLSLERAGLSKSVTELHYSSEDRGRSPDLPSSLGQETRIYPVSGLYYNPKTAKPTGLIQGEAKRMVESCLEFPEHEMLLALENVQKRLLALGITSVHHISSSISLIKKFAESGKLLLRTYFCPTWDEKTGVSWCTGEEMTSPLKLGVVKFFTDG
ncbi:MAG TPA: amidohydrolase family protein, partial [Candidatus Hypogeohydataceae bacterium YC40]